MPARLRALPADEVARLLEAVEAGGGEDDIRTLVKHFLAVLERRWPGKSVEVRVPPYAAVQCIGGPRHTRGTPGAVVETDALTWIALARGETSFSEARRAGAVRASGERSDLSEQLPLT